MTVSKNTTHCGLNSFRMHESIPHISMNDFNPIRSTAGSELYERVVGQIELGEKEGTFGLKDSIGGELL